MQSEIWELVSRLRIEGDHSILENRQMKLSALFDYQKVDHEKDNTVRLLLTVEAPVIDWVAQRPKICVLPVLDISASMRGAKFDYARQACRKLLEQLRPGDYAGLIVFAHQARVVVAPAPVTPELKTRLLRELDRLQPVGGTNFSEAVTMSLGALGDLDLPPNVLQRAIFFTDGEPTSGVVDHNAIKNLLTANLRSFSMSFFGYGDPRGGGCDQQFLTELSDLGKGNYAYVQNPDDALSAFGKELGGLLSTYATDLRLVIEPRNGHSIERVITSLGPKLPSVTPDLTELPLELGDILAEEERHVVLECTVRKQDKALPRDFTIFNVTATCQRVTPDGSKASEETSAAAKIRFVQPDDAQKTPTPEVDKIVALHQLSLAQREAEERAAKGNFSDAQAVLQSFAQEAQSRGYVGVAGVASNIQAGMLPGLYKSTEGYRTSVGKALVRSSRVSSYDRQAQVDLSSLPLGGGGTSGTSAQMAYSRAFTTPAVAPVESSPAVVPLTSQEPANPILVPPAGTAQWYGAPAEPAVNADSEGPAPSGD